MRIEAAQPNDLEEICQVQEVLGPRHTDRLIVRKDMQEGDFYVIRDDKIYGVMWLEIQHNTGYTNTIYIKTTAVHKDMQRKGIGTKLLDYTIELAKQHGIKNIRCSTTSKYNSKPFIDASGFVLTFDMEGVDQYLRRI